MAPCPVKAGDGRDSGKKKWTKPAKGEEKGRYRVLKIYVIFFNMWKKRKWILSKFDQAGSFSLMSLQVFLFPQVIQGSR